MRRFIVSFVSLVAIAAAATTAAHASNTNYLTSQSTPEQVLVQPDGRILVSASDGATSAIVRLGADGQTDRSFNGGVVRVGGRYGIRDKSLAVQSDGKILVLSREIDNTTELIRLNKDGSRDHDFGPVTFEGFTTAMLIAVQPDGKILVASSNVECDRYSSCAGNSKIFRLLPNGKYDQGFADGGVAAFKLAHDHPELPFLHDESIDDLGLDSSGNIYVDGSFGSMAVFGPDGKPLTGFGTDGTLVPENDLGRFTIHGSQITSIIPGGHGGPNLVRYGLDGTPDNSFGTGGIALVPYPAPMPPLDGSSFGSVDPQVSADGSILVGSPTISSCTDSEPYSCNGGIVLERFTPSGVPDPSWGQSGIVNMDFGKNGGYVLVADSQPDQKLVAATLVPNHSEDDVAQMALIRFNLNGSLDETFGKAGISSVPEQLPSCLNRPASYPFSIVDGYPTKGSNASDTMAGSDSADDISGLSGDDFICGYGAKDRLKGQAGKDRLSGGNGADTISGGPGADTIYGGTGRDDISGGAGNDRILARDGVRDKVLCGAGKDTVRVDRRDVVKGCEKVRPRRR